jgi:hypothetical protein
MANEPINLDLIRMVQQARLAHDADAMPSQISSVYWIEVKREGDGPGPTPRIGAFEIRTTLADVDRLWVMIREATRDGRLGYKSKVSTAARAGSGDPNERVIVVLTADIDDAADVERVRATLAGLAMPGALTAHRYTDGG